MQMECRDCAGTGTKDIPLGAKGAQCPECLGVGKVELEVEEIELQDTNEGSIWT